MNRRRPPRLVTAILVVTAALMGCEPSELYYPKADPIHVAVEGSILVLQLGGGDDGIDDVPLELEVHALTDRF
ncbi:uncharacterized protein METZ01_LOCUS500669, partial [marine metagenome]